MKLMILFSLLLPILSFKIGKQHLCINCKHFKKDFLSDDKFGKCSLFKKEITNYDYLVDGYSKQIKDYYYCSTARQSEDMCGKKGILFEKKK